MRKKLMKQTALLLAMVMAVSTAYSGNVIEIKAASGTTDNVAGYVLEGTSEEEITYDPGNEEVTGEEITGEDVTGETVSGETESGETGTGETESGETESITDEPTTSEEVTTQEETTTTEETTTPEETTTAEYIVIDGLYKIRQTTGSLVEYLGKNDANIKDLVIPVQVEAIEKEVFRYSKYIETVTFAQGSKLTIIGDYAFNECAVLKSIVLPEGVTDLGYKTFGKCPALAEFTIPSTVTSGTEIFGGTNYVKKVTIAPGMATVPEGILRYAASVQEVVIGEGVKTIAKQAFYKCTSLTTVSLPSTVTAMKTSAFNGCTALTTITLPETFKSLGGYVFKNCTSLLSLEIPKTTTSIGNGVFSGDTNIVLRVYANSKGKKYARSHNIKWQFAPSEIKRQAENTAIYNNFVSQIKKKDRTKFDLTPYLDKYVPQGTCIIGNYIVVSMYYKTLKKNSILVLFNKSSGKFVKKLTVPAKDHVGAVTNVKNRLVISLNNISSTDYVAIVSLSKLKKAKTGATIKFEYKVKLPGYADFAAYDGKFFWAGRSANISNATMQGYKVKVKNKKLTFTRSYSFVVPANSQGLIVQRVGKSSKRDFIFAQSYGRLNNSKLITYRESISKITQFGAPTSEKTLPSMLEGIILSKKNSLFMVFESGAGLYCGDPDNTSEIQVNNVSQMKYSKLSKLQ